MSSDPRWGDQGRDAKAAAIWETLAAVAPDAGRGCWLDVGCGSGEIIAALAPRLERAIGIDPEPWGRWAELQQGRPGLTYAVGSYAADHAGIADVVICNHVYEHVPDPVRLIETIFDALKPGGYCYFAGPNLLWPVEPHVRWPFVHWLPRPWAVALLARFSPARVRDMDAYLASRRRLVQWVQRQGFEVRSIEWERARSAPATERGILVRLLAALPRSFAQRLAPVLPTLVFVLRRP